jgi:hypothetical protein
LSLVKLKQPSIKCVSLQNGREQGYCLKRVTWLDGIARFLYVPVFVAFVALFINQSEMVVPNTNLEQMNAFIPNKHINWIQVAINRIITILPFSQSINSTRNAIKYYRIYLAIAIEFYTITWALFYTLSFLNQHL